MEAMDRPLDSSVLKLRLLKRVAVAVLIVSGLLLAFGGFRRLITPSLDGKRIRTAVVEQGRIEATITASGTVVPEFEETLSSPIDSRVLEVLKRPGETVRRGDPILALDTSATRMELENLEEQIALKQNERRTQALVLQKAMIAQESQFELKQVDLESRQARHQRLERLFRDGLTAESDLTEALLDIRRTEIELRQLRESMDNLSETTSAEIDRLRLETNILLKQTKETRRRLDLATARALDDGVLTWVIQEKGATVRQGDVLARIADLERLRVDATVSDVYSPRLAEGLPVRVKVGGEYLSGRVRTVLPTIQDGTVTLLIELDDASHPDLRSNLRVDVFIITDAKENALKVRKGPFASGAGRQQAFVVRQGQAYRTEIEIGLSSFDHLEIVSGVAAGDEIVISDMTDYKHMKQVRIR
jgi:HlyD family secretion protein